MTGGVLTRSYTNDRAGVYSEETILTAQAVAERGIKRLWSLNLPGDARGAEAAPLIVPGVKLANGQAHDLLVVATMANQVIAADAHSGALLWSEQLGRPIDNTVAIDSYFNAEKHWINDHWGILSTPVVDRSNEMLYACSWSSPDGLVARAQHYLEAVSLVSGKRARPSLNLEGAVFDPGGGVPVQRFASAARKQRASLLQLGQTVFVGFGSIWESAASNRGWVIAIDVKQWKVTAAWCTAVKGSGGGIWQAGAGLAADAAGDIILMTGNGDFDAETDWGECVIKLRYTPPGPALMGELKVVDWFSPFLDSERVAPPSSLLGALTAVSGRPRSPTNTRRYTMVSADQMDAAGNIPLNEGQADDMDLGSGGPVVIDELGVVLAAGKDGILYAVRLNAMGGTTARQLTVPAGVAANYRELACPPLWFPFYTPDASPMPSDIRSINYLFGGTTHHQHGSPIVWKSPQGWRLACWGENSTLRLWSIEALPNTNLSPTLTNVKISYLAAGDIVASAQVAVPPGGMPGAPMTLSWDGKNADTPAIWACVPYFDANRVVSAAQLVAYGANDIADGQMRKLWTSEQWNLPFTLAKFTGPVVWGGKVYVPTFDARIDVYGLA